MVRSCGVSCCGSSTVRLVGVTPQAASSSSTRPTNGRAPSALSRVLASVEPGDGRTLLAASPQEPAEGGLAERGIERRHGAVVELEGSLERRSGDLVVPPRGGELAPDAGESGKA